MAFKARDIALATKAKAAGANYALRTVLEARRYNVPISLAFAFAEKETGEGTHGAHNIYGRDNVRNRAPKGRPVTERNYHTVYLPDREDGMGNQGVGPFQLTAKEFQDKADNLGGAWKPAINIRVGLQRIGELLEKYPEDKYGPYRAVASFNGGERGWRNGLDYAHDVRHRQRYWHNKLK